MVLFVMSRATDLWSLWKKRMITINVGAANHGYEGY